MSLRVVQEHERPEPEPAAPSWFDRSPRLAAIAVGAAAGAVVGTVFSIIAMLVLW